MMSMEEIEALGTCSDLECDVQICRLAHTAKILYNQQLTEHELTTASLTISAYLQIGEGMGWTGMNPAEILVLRNKLLKTKDKLERLLLER